MNRTLFTLSLLMILLGVGVGFYFLAFVGLLLMIPSLLAPSRPAARTGPMQVPARQQPRRISPPPVTQHQPAYPPTQPKSEVVVPPAPSMVALQATYSAPLFPSPMFPTLSLMGANPQAAKETPQQKQGERDELVEVGAILALLKLALG